MVKNILITGASEGIGRETALQLAKDPNNRLLLLSRNQVRLNNLIKTINTETNLAFAYCFDMVSDDYEPLLGYLNDHFGKIDVLINNAGAIINKPFKLISTGDFDKIINTNYKGPFFLIQHLLPMFNEGAHIVNISSMGGFQGAAKFPGLSLYSSSKGALATLSECLAVELAPLKISVNCLSLGSVQTAMFEQAFPGYTAQTSSESMAAWVSYFALNGHQWMNGKILPISVSTP